MSWTITKEKVEAFLKMWIMLSATVFPVLYFLGQSLVIEPLEEKFKEQEKHTIEVKKELDKVHTDYTKLKSEVKEIITSKNYMNLIEIAEHLDKADLKEFSELVEEFDNHNVQINRSITRLQFDIEKLQDKDSQHDSHIQNLFYGKEPKNSYLP